MHLTLRMRLTIIVLGSLGLVVDGWLIVKSGPNPRLEIPQAIVDRRFNGFGDGPLVDHTGTEGDFARAGYIWASQHEPSGDIKCANRVPSFRRGCLAWLADMRRLDENWDSDRRSR